MYRYPNYEEGSFCLGMTYAFCELVCRDLKRIGLSNPMEQPLFEQLWEDTQQIMAHFSVKGYVEKDLVSTLLAPDEACKGRVIVLFYKQDADLAEYLALHERVAALQASDSYTYQQKQQATIQFCRLLSYSEQQIAEIAAQ